MVIKYNNYIKESPDHIYVNGRKINMFDNIETIAFAYIKDEKIKDEFKNQYLNKIFTIKSVHPVILNLIKNNGIIKL